MTDDTARKQLMLHLERALVAQRRCRDFLAAADATVADRRRDLRNLKVRIARQSHLSRTT